MNAKLMMKARKRQRRSRRVNEDKEDRLSMLSDCILLHIMSLMDTTDAIQTCVLSKRWRNVWKRLDRLSFERMYFRTSSISNYNKFVSRVLSRRDSSIPLQSLDFVAEGSTAPKLVNKVMEYIAFHDVPQLTVYIDLFSVTIPNFSIPFIFSCPSLTFLKLSISGHILKLPESLQLPALKSLYLENVHFTAHDNSCATRPFSNCNLLNTLIIKDCSLYGNAKILRISNSNLSSLSLESNSHKPHTIVLSTPHLCSLTVKDHFSYHAMVYTCDLPFLEEMKIDISYNIDSQSWWEVFSNVKILTLSGHTIVQILEGFPPSRSSIQRKSPPCFVSLELLKMEMSPDYDLSDEAIAMVAEFFLRNSPLARVAVISC